MGCMQTGLTEMECQREYLKLTSRVKISVALTLNFARRACRMNGRNRCACDSETAEEEESRAICNLET
jgi:hypothetical protein